MFRLFRSISTYNTDITRLTSAIVEFAIKYGNSNINYDNIIFHTEQLYDKLIDGTLKDNDTLILVCSEFPDGERTFSDVMCKLADKMDVYLFVHLSRFTPKGFDEAYEFYHIKGDIAHMKKVTKSEIHDINFKIENADEDKIHTAWLRSTNTWMKKYDDMGQLCYGVE